jgi:hypothetical protein
VIRIKAEKECLSGKDLYLSEILAAPLLMEQLFIFRIKNNLKKKK